MLQGLLLALALLQAPARSADHGPAGATLPAREAPPRNAAQRCAIQGGDAVPTMQVAREIGEAIIRGRQSAADRALFELSVEPAGTDAWDVVQSIPDRIEPDGSRTITNGGGMAIRIDRCTGAVRFIHYLI